MLYSLVKIWARLGLVLYCRQIDLTAFNVPDTEAPLILAANHPNSFFDAILLGALSPRPLHFMTRGDAFRNPRVARILRALHMIPIHRLSEGKEHLHLNDESFATAVQILRNKGAVLIFSEGLCVNEWKLRPLKKGTARLAWQAWEDSALSGMQVIPVGLNYDSFRRVPKRIRIETGARILNTEVRKSGQARFYQWFNSSLETRLRPLIHSSKKISAEQNHPGKRIILLTALSLPAMLGYLIHRPIYAIVRNIARKKTAGTVFYDSVQFALLLVLYPLIVLILSVIIVLVSDSVYCFALLFLLPALAWSYKTWVATARAQ